ncbi:MAG: PAS domain-containing protein [Myxococcota bacterium]|nr:PAS domain-containing protein [Myxococcota bacterium]
MRMTLRGSPPDDILAAIEAAGFQASTSPEVVLHWLGDEAPEPGAVVLFSSIDRLEEVLASGAIEVVLALTPRAVLLHLTRWRRQQSSHQRTRSERRSMEQKVRSLKQLKAELLQTSPLPILASNRVGKIVIFNQAAAALLGYSSDYACSQMHVSDIYANPTDARRVLVEIRCASRGHIHGFAIRIRARSGEQIPIFLSATEVLSDQGESAYTIGILSDRRPELALRSRLDAASKQVILSEQRASGVTTTRIAIHELNQPLTALMGSIELMDMRSDLADEVRTRLNSMYDQLDRMAEIVRGLGGEISSQESS